VFPLNPRALRDALVGGIVQSMDERPGTRGRATRLTSRSAISSPAPPCSALMLVRWKASTAQQYDEILGLKLEDSRAPSSLRLVIALQPISMRTRPRSGSRRNKFSPTFELSNTQLQANKIMSTNTIKTMKTLLTLCKTNDSFASSSHD